MAGDDPPAAVRVAIVGGGYAGLALAGLLARGSQPGTEKTNGPLSPAWEPWVLETKDEPIPIVGKIRLPTAKKLLDRLGLVLSSPIGAEGLVDRQAFQTVLRQPLQSSNEKTQQHRLVFGCRIVGISSEGEKTSTKWLVDDRGHRHGPYERVVVANGLFGDSCSELLRLADAVVGDARWQFDLPWPPWEPGHRKRIREGGDLALADALVLADALMEGTVPELFSPARALKKQKQSILLKRAFLVLGFAILCRLVAGLEKI